MSGRGAPSRERDAAVASEVSARFGTPEGTRVSHGSEPVATEHEAAEQQAAEHEAAEQQAAEQQAAEQQAADGDSGQGAGLLPDVAALAAERDEYLSALQRLQADFENYRKRVLRQLEEQAARGAAELVSKLLPVLDVLDLAESHLGAGADARSEAQALGQARSLMVDVLTKEGLERVGEADVPFDPSVHDAVAHAPAAEGEPVEEGAGEGARAARAAAGPVVEEVLRAGYRWRGQVLRPAMVRVRG